jgi:hypothetical protein
MNDKPHGFGVLTLASEADWQKAIGLARSLRRSNPGVPIAVTCHPNLVPRLAPHFDRIVHKRGDVSGFKHKIYLDEYTPWQKTLFLDADILVVKNVREALTPFSGAPYTARGRYRDSGFSSFGMNIETVLESIGKNQLVYVGGAGHGYFEKPQCQEFFDLARKVMANWHSYSNPSDFTDEDIVSVTMTLMELRPMPKDGFMGRVCFARKNTFHMDPLVPYCEFVEQTTGERIQPTIVHFARWESPFYYHYHLERLAQADSGRRNLWWWVPALREWWVMDVFRPAKRLIKRLVRNK